MDWMEVVVHTTTEGADIVSEVLMNYGAVGTVIEDRSDIPQSGQRKEGFWELIDDSLVESMSEDVLVKAYIEDNVKLPETISVLRDRFVELSKVDIGFDLGSLAVDIQTVHEQDWAENWKQYYKPFHAGERLVVKPSWEHYEPKASDLVIEMDPGMAFGTGTHETTNMCMQMLEKYVEPGMSCIDIGTGTGILAIAAAMLGAKDVLAIDLDEKAVQVAKENIKKNHLEGTVRAMAGDLLKQTSESAQVVVANIIADVICFLAKPARDHILPGGVLICSGIIREREQDVLHSLKAANYTIENRIEKGEWVCLAARL